MGKKLDVLKKAAGEAARLGATAEANWEERERKKRKNAFGF